MSSDELSHLKRRVSLLHIVQEKVKLRRQGAEYAAKCPFHADDTPSLMINPEKGVWHCHGCGKGGDIFTWIQQVEGLDFPAAADRLRELAGEPLKEFRSFEAGKSGAAVAAEYIYVDEKGDRLYRVNRKEFLLVSRDGKKKRQKTFVQYRWDAKSQRWVSGLGDARRVLFRLPEVISGPDPVWIVEGEKDALTLAALGLTATTWSGGTNSAWLPSFTEVLKGRQVILCPDTDEPGQKRADELVQHLAGACRLRWVKIPAPHKDVTDWLRDGGTKDELLALAAAAPLEADRPPEQKVPKLYGRAAAHGKRECNEIAEEILTQRSILSDQFGYVYLYNGRFWERITSKVLQKLAKDSDTLLHTNRRRRGEIADYLEMATQVPTINWRQVEPSEVPLDNGVYRLADSVLRPHRKEDFLETVVPVIFDPAARCPRWEKALMEYFGGDEDQQAKVAALQQFFGYCLLPHARYKKALILYGEGDTGKSLVAKLLQELVGKTNCCGVSVEAMDDERKRVPLVGKLLNVLTEISAKAVIADGGFKTLISTEEEMLMDPKYLPQFMYAPIAKHVVATNNLPTINDLTRATYNRLLVVKFNRVIRKSDQNPEILTELRKELPGILNWALAGAADLSESAGEWVEIPESRRIVEEYRSNENEINAFLEEETVREQESYLRAPTLRDRFRRWAGKVYSQKAIGSMMAHAGFPGVPCAVNGCRVYRGLRWREAGVE